MVEIRAPFVVNIDVTHRCNLKCSYCYNSGFLENAMDIDVERCKNLITELFDEHQIFHMTIAGGEPLLHSGIFDIIESCFLKYDPRIALLSNGTPLLDNEIFEKFASVCKTLDDNDTTLKMQISIDSHDPEVNDLQRERGSDVLQAIDRALTLPIELQLACVITRKNIEVADQIVEAYYPRVKNFHYMNIMPSHGRSGGAYFWRMKPTDKQIEDFHSRILELERKHSPIRISKIKRECELGMSGGTIRSKGCLAGTTRIEIDPNLDVRACCMSNEILGNLSNQSFGEMWFSDHAESIRNQSEPYCSVWK